MFDKPSAGAGGDTDLDRKKHKLNVDKFEWEKQKFWAEQQRKKLDEEGDSARELQNKLAVVKGTTRYNTFEKAVTKSQERATTMSGVSNQAQKFLALRQSNAALRKAPQYLREALVNGAQAYAGSPDTQKGVGDAAFKTLQFFGRIAQRIIGRQYESDPELTKAIKAVEPALIKEFGKDYKDNKKLHNLLEGMREMDGLSRATFGQLKDVFNVDGRTTYQDEIRIISAMILGTDHSVEAFAKMGTHLSNQGSTLGLLLDQFDVGRNFKTAIGDTTVDEFMQASVPQIDNYMKSIYSVSGAASRASHENPASVGSYTRNQLQQMYKVSRDWHTKVDQKSIKSVREFAKRWRNKGVFGNPTAIDGGVVSKRDKLKKRQEQLRGR